MKGIKIYIAVFMVTLVLAACKKAPVPTQTNTTAQLSANANSTVLVFTGTAAQTSPNEFSISGTTGTGVKLLISFSAAGPGTVKIGSPTYGGQATFTSATGVVWSTDFSDSGAIYVSTYNTVNNNIAGTFNFVGNETKPTPNASTLAVTSGSFNLTW